MNHFKVYYQPEKSKNRSGHNLTPSGRNALSPTSSIGIMMPSDSLSPFMMLDCLKPTEIIVSFSSFSRWFDPNAPNRKEGRKSYLVLTLDEKIIFIEKEKFPKNLRGLQIFSVALNYFLTCVLSFYYDWR